MTYSDINIEKAEAMMRYHHLRKAENMWRILEASVALLLVSRWLPAAAKIGVDHLLQVSEYLYNPHINFVLGNAIIVVIVLLSRQRTTGGSGGGGDKFAGAVDFVDECLEIGEVHLRIASATVSVPELETQALPISPAANEEEKRIVAAPENAEDDSVITVLEEAKEQLRRFQRSQSEKLRRDLRVKKTRPELIRSETEMKPRASSAAVAVKSGQKLLKSTNSSPVESLSSDEFKKTIEDFIAKHRRSLSEQKIGEENSYQIS